ncbi:MAG: hypothetical protein JST00_22810 [Deltaproteobacteria bacterium]|nr:hypothetical protein [Deltaproteobacteria bacterium]
MGSVVALVALSSLAIAAPGSSGPGVQPPGTGPGPVPFKQPARIASMDRIVPPKADPSFSGGIKYSIEVRASTFEALNTQLRIRRGVLVVGAVPAETLATFPVTAPAGGSVKVTFDDPGGLREGSCTATMFFLDLVGLSGTTKLQQVLPTCSLSTTTEDPTAPIPPDTKQAQRANRLQYLTPSITQQPTCAQWLVVSTTVKNATSKVAKSVKLVLDGPKDKQSAVPELQPGATTTQTAQIHEGLYPGKYVLKLDDPTNSVGGAIYQMGWNVTISRSCQPVVGNLESRPDQ